MGQLGIRRRCATGTAFGTAYTTTHLINTVAFGFTAARSGGTVTVSNSFTDATSNNTGFTLTSFDTCTGSGFENITDAKGSGGIHQADAVFRGGRNAALTETDVAVDPAGLVFCEDKIADLLESRGNGNAPNQKSSSSPPTVPTATSNRCHRSFAAALAGTSSPAC